MEFSVFSGSSRWQAPRLQGYHPFAMMVAKRYVAIAALSFWACRCLCGALPQHSVSPSRQFIIYGADGLQRAAVSQLAEQTKSNLLKLLSQPDRWKTPIVINLQKAQVNVPELPPADLRFSQTGFGLKLQLDLTIASDGDVSFIERELLRTTLLEMIYRSQPDVAPGTAYVEPPDWLIEGALALTPGRDREALVAAVDVSDAIVPLDQFLRQRPGLLEPSGRVRYRAHALVLVEMLVESQNGRSQLARYIENLPVASNDPLADLKMRFPLLGDGLEARWPRQVRRFTRTGNYQLLTFNQSEKQLRELLRLKITEARQSTKSMDLDDLLRRKLSSEETAMLSLLSRQLLLLGARAHPLMRPIVREYQQIAALRANRKGHKLSCRLARVTTTRAQLGARMEEIDDYINWFEATQLQSNSGAFADYLKAAGNASSEKLRRRDALSVYLDALETQF